VTLFRGSTSAWALRIPTDKSGPKCKPDQAEEIFWLAAGAFQKLIVNAVPSYPLRLASVVTDFLPSIGGDEEPGKKVVTGVSFGPGDAYMNRAAHQELDKVVEALVVLTLHTPTF